MNENYPQPAIPEGCSEGILKGMYRVAGSRECAVRLLGSGAILPQALSAARILEEQFSVTSEVWSVTSYKELYRDACSAERSRRCGHSGDPASPYVSQCLGHGTGPVVAATDYVRAVPESVGKWIPGRYITLGTDGFGRSDGRESLRDFFEVDDRHIAHAALAALREDGEIGGDIVDKAVKVLGLDVTGEDPDKR